MSNTPKVALLLVCGVLSALLIPPRVASGQSDRLGKALPDRPDTTWAALDVSAVLNRAIEESSNGPELRERVVRRISECSLMYGGLSTLTANAEARKSYVQAQEATMEVESAIAKPLQSQRRLQLEGEARNSVALMLRAIKVQGDKEVGPLLKKCRALNDVKEIKNALRELPRE